MPIYSFGVNSILKIELSEDEAAAYNRFTQAFFDAQTAYREIHGTRWDPEQALKINCNEADLAEWNRIGKLLNAEIQKINQDETPIELDEDFLIKN